MENQCRQDPPLEILKAVEQFNRGNYYECHETLEALWRDEQQSIRELYKGILQIGVAIHHAQRANLKGALRLISTGMELLSRFAPCCLGIDVTGLVAMTDHTRKELQRLAPGQRLAPELLPKIRVSRHLELSEKADAGGEALADHLS